MRLQGSLLVMLLLFNYGENLYSQVPEIPFENSHFETVDSVRFHYRVWNDHLANPKGKVVLIHGFCGSTFCWRYNYDSLAAANYKVVAIDLPGFGYSERDATLNQSQSNRGRLIWELLKQIDGADTSMWNIVGHSMGGGTAEALALMNLGRTRSLTILNGMIFLKNNDVNVRVVGLVNHPVYKKILVSYTKHQYLSFKNFRRELKSTYGFLPDTATVMGYYTPLQIEGTAETVVNLLANSKEIQELDAEGLSQIPVLVIWGKKDRTIRVSNGKKLKKAVPSVEFEVIPDARHMPMETHPELVNRMLIQFLNRNNR